MSFASLMKSMNESGLTLVDVYKKMETGELSMQTVFGDLKPENPEDADSIVRSYIRNLRKRTPTEAFGVELAGVKSVKVAKRTQDDGQGGTMSMVHYEREKDSDSALVKIPEIFIKTNTPLECAPTLSEYTSLKCNAGGKEVKGKEVVPDLTFMRIDGFTGVTVDAKDNSTTDKKIVAYLLVSALTQLGQLKSSEYACLKVLSEKYNVFPSFRFYDYEGVKYFLRTYLDNTLNSPLYLNTSYQKWCKANKITSEDGNEVDYDSVVEEITIKSEDTSAIPDKVIKKSLKDLFQVLRGIKNFRNYFNMPLDSEKFSIPSNSTIDYKYCKLREKSLAKKETDPVDFVDPILYLHTNSVGERTHAINVHTDIKKAKYNFTVYDDQEIKKIYADECKRLEAVTSTSKFTPDMPQELVISELMFDKMCMFKENSDMKITAYNNNRIRNAQQ